MHQVWFQGWEKLPKKFHSNIKKLVELNPTWEHKTWDEAQLRAMCAEYSAECVERFDSYEHMIQKVDFGRYVVLYMLGGVALDCDLEPFRPLDEIPEINFSPLIVGKSNDSAFETGVITFGHLVNDDWFINNAFMACKPKNPDVMRLIESCIKDKTSCKDYFSRVYCISLTTGPVRLSTVLKDSNMTILCPNVLESEYPSENMFFIHSHELSWADSLSTCIMKSYLFVKEHKHLFIIGFIILLAIYLL